MTESTGLAVGVSYADLAAAYEAERPHFKALAERIEAALNRELGAAGVYCELSCRAKEIPSFLKKALREGYSDPLREIGDKAGVRVIVPYLKDVPRVEEAVAALCHIDDREQKLEALDYDRLGYLGVHLDVRPRPEILVAHPDLGADHSALHNHHAELQIHSKAQSAWAVVSHDLLYKPPVESPVEAKRAIARLVALVEIFDGEVDRLRKVIESAPDLAEMTVAVELDEYLIRFTSKRPDRKLSALSVPTLVHLYECPPAEVTSRYVGPFVETNEQKLRDIYAAFEDDETANPLLSQPEALLIFERLESDRDRLRERWPVDNLSFELLDGMALVAGIDL